ncbi:MAG: hypothetical protein IKR77_08835 [Bacteroidales bacterium]|nr:hypothetical protein [Bacteroidales bacterium]
MSRNQNNSIFAWIGLSILLILPNIARTQSVKLTLFATDSLTGEIVTSYCVYINDSIFFHSLDENNAAYFVLDNTIDHSFRIRVHNSHYHDRIFDLKMPKTLSDTTIHVKMNYIFSEPQLPLFFFDSASVVPDTNFNAIYSEPVFWLGKIQKANDFTIQLNAFCLSENNSEDQALCEQRIKCIKNILVQHGVDSSKMDVLIHPFEPYQILYPEEFDQFYHFKDILDEEFIRNLPANEKSKAMKYNSRITVTVADNYWSTVTPQQREFCFRFFDKFGAEVTPSEMLVLDNTGAVINLDSSKCFRHKADTSYSFILQVTDRDYYFFQKQYDANEMSGCDTVRLENIETVAKLVVSSHRLKLNNRQKKQIVSFFSNSKRGFHRIVILVGKPTRAKIEARQGVKDIIMLYEKDMARRNIQQTPDVMVHFYDLLEAEDTFTFEIVAYNYK